MKSDLQNNLSGTLFNLQGNLAYDLVQSGSKAKRLKDKVDDNHKTIGKLKTVLEGSIPGHKLLATLDAQSNTDTKLCVAQTRSN